MLALFYKNITVVIYITIFIYCLINMLITFRIGKLNILTMYWNTSSNLAKLEFIEPHSQFTYEQNIRREENDYQKEITSNMNLKKNNVKRIGLSHKTVSSTFAPDITSTWSNETKMFFRPYLQNVKSFCNNKIKLYNHIIILFNNLTMFPHLASTKGIPGAHPTDVLNQKEENEEYTLQRGFFTKSCDFAAYKVFRSLSPPKSYSKWELAFRITRDEIDTSKFNIETKFTVAVQRREYANVYWMLIDLYDVFATVQLLNQSANMTNILLLDAKPWSHLDSLWNIFHSVKKPNQIDKPILFTNMNWLFPRETSPVLVKSIKPIPLLPEFRQFIFNSYSITSYRRTCAKLNIHFLWRRNYIAHPRNPTGLISRKIKNEAELLKTTQLVFTKHTIKGYQFDLYNISEQLQIISRTDILIGMHGAGMSYSIFLPKQSAVIEMFPAYYLTYNWHMEYLSRRSGHVYLKWRNNNHALENIRLQYTFVPPGVVVNLIQKALKLICPHSKRNQ